MIRRSAFALGLLLVGLVAALAWLVGTTPGARWLAGRAQALEPRLSVEVSGGSLIAGLDLRAVRWRADALGVSVRRARLDWDPRCLFNTEICAGPVTIDGLDVTVDTGTAGGEPAAEPGAGRIEAPLPIGLSGLTVTDARVRFDERVITFDRLETAADWAGTVVEMHPTLLQGLTVRLPATADTPAASAAPGPLHITLPAVRAPVDLVVSDFRLVDGTLEQGGQRRRLQRLSLAGRWSGTTLRLDRLRAVHERGEVGGRVEIDAVGEWPVDARLAVTLPDLLEGGEQRLELKAAGSLADLKLDISASGPVAARVEAGVQVLAPDLPWEVFLQSEALQWPPASGAMVTARDVRVEARGDLDHWWTTIATRLSGESIPVGEWQGTAEGDWQSATIRTLNARTLSGRLALEGRLRWAPAVSWEGTVEAEGIDPQSLVAELPGTISARAAVEGAIEDEGWRLDADLQRLDGRLRGYSLSARARLRHAPNGVWTIEDARISSGDNTLTASGSVGERLEFSAAFDFRRLNQLWPDLSGATRGTVAVTGSREAPTVELDASADDLAYRQFRARALTLSARVADLALAPSRLAVSVVGAAQGARTFGDAEATLTGTRAEHRLELTTTESPADAEIVATGGLVGDGLDWRGRLLSARVRAPDGPWRLVAPFALEWRGESAVAWLAPHCWRRESARLCLEEPAVVSADAADGVLTLADYPIADLSPWLPEGLTARGQVAARVEVDWVAGERPRVTASVTSDGGALTVDPADTDARIDFGYRRIALDVVLRETEVTASLDIASDRLGNAALDLRADPYAEDYPIAGTVRLDGLRLGVARPFLPQLTELEGVISADGELSGTLRQPAYRGEVRLDEGLIQADGVPVPVEAIALQVTVEGREAVLKGSFRMGEGEARLAGSGTWGEQLQATVAVTGERLTVEYPPYARLAVSPALVISVLPGEVTVGGRISVPSGRITIEELPTQAVSVSDDVVIVNQATGEGEQQPSWTVRSNLYLVLGDDVRFSGFGASGRLDGELQLRQVGAAGAEASGRIRLLEGRFEAYGQRLEIRRGELIFAGPISEPQLQIEAVRRVESVVAGLQVSGPASAPEVTLFSEPPMPQRDILTYLLTGRAPGTAAPSEEQLVSQAALSFGLFGGQAIGSAVAEEIGIEDFRVEATGSGEETNVAVSGYLSPNLMVRYGVGVFQPQNVLTLRYYVTQRLYLEAVSGLESALDVFYSFDF